MLSTPVLITGQNQCGVPKQNANVPVSGRGSSPFLTALTEGLVDKAADAIGMDPVDIRRKNLLPDDSYPRKSPTGMLFEQLSHQESLEKIVQMMDYEMLRKEQGKLRDQGVYRGIGIATFIEVTNPVPCSTALAEPPSLRKMVPRSALTPREI